MAEQLYYYGHDKNGAIIMIQLCIDDFSYTSKPEKNEYIKISKRISKCEVCYDLSHIADLVGNHGYAFTPATFHNQYRKKENFQSMQLFALDFDTGIRYNEIAETANNYGLPIAFAYKTFSHTESHERFRVVFLFDAIITDRNIAEMILAMLLKIFSQADPACKDVSRVFLGGKGLIDVHNQMCSPLTCIESFERKMIEDDNSRHVNRNIQNFARKYSIGLSTKNKIRIQKKSERPDYYENGAKSASPYYIYKGLAENAPYFYIISKENKTPFISDSNVSSEPLRAYYIKKTHSLCQLLRDAEDDIYKLDHGERFFLLCNLRHINGGAKYFFKLIEKSHPEKIKDWKIQYRYIKRNDYEPRCNSYCKYSDTCKHKATLIKTLLQHERFEIISPASNYVSLDDAALDLETNFHESVSANNQDIYILEAQTAIGKTRMYCNYIQKHFKQKKFLIATPTNQLKNEVAERLRALNVPVLESLSVSELEYISPRLKKKILKLYDNGYSSITRKSIKKSLRKECQKSSENYDNITRDDVC